MRCVGLHRTMIDKKIFSTRTTEIMLEMPGTFATASTGSYIPYGGNGPAHAHQPVDARLFAQTVPTPVSLL